jgi:hypothetical protein
MKFKIIFYPGVDKEKLEDREDLETGLISEISWQRMHDYLEKAFAIKEHERLVGITVTEYGIKAKIKFK